MKKLLLLFITFMMISACGSADNFLEDITEGEFVDSIIVNPPKPSDSTDVKPSDTIIVINDSTAVPKDSTSGGNDSIPSDSLHVKDKPEIEYTKLFMLTSTSKNSTQGFAIYGNMLFNCHHSNDVIDVFNLETQEKVTSINLKPETIVHCNNVNFGSEFYDEDDKYPLLYIQQRGYACKLNAYRIVCNGDSIIGAEKVQTISFEECEWCSNAIDITNSLLYGIYRYKQRNYISAFKLPSAKKGDLSIHPTSALKSYYLPAMAVLQDTAFKGNFLYWVNGHNQEGQLWRIDITDKTARMIDLTKYGLNEEPEGIDIYNNNIIVSFLNTSLYNIKILEN